jgi:hypothetical protein
VIAPPPAQPEPIGSCGIRVASSSERELSAAVAEIKAKLGPGPHQHIILFFAITHDASALSDLMALTFPGIAVSGCTTAGEILPEGMSDGAILAIAFPQVGFTIHSDLISPLDSLSVESVGETVRRLKSNLIQPPPQQDHVFALMLVDGMSSTEETLVAAIHWAIGDIPLIGGSAGDGLAFKYTAMIHGGRVYNHAALLLMIETDVPFKVFKTSNFDPTAIKLVVTAADTTNRTVFELNAEPAAREYAAAIGLLPNDLGPFSFASYPLVVKVGGDYYCRSIRNMNPDGSLTFFCAIDEGLVFTVASPQDMLKSAEQTLTEVESALGSIDLVLGFDCILRRLDAENRQIRHQVDKLYRQFKLVGFHSYGEQFNAMHLNQTLTGIAFGPRRPAQNDPTP